jgi:hypothetical protein
MQILWIHYSAAEQGFGVSNAQAPDSTISLMGRSNGHEDRCRTVETLYELYRYANLHMGTHTMKNTNVGYC